MLLHGAPPLKLTQAPPSFPSIIRCGFRGSSQRSWLSPWGVGTATKVLPPSVDRKSAPSSASTSAQTRPVFAGDTATPVRPMTPVGRPGLRVISVQLSPPSVDLKSPLPGPPLLRYQ